MFCSSLKLSALCLGPPFILEGNALILFVQVSRVVCLWCCVSRGLCVCVSSGRVCIEGESVLCVYLCMQVRAFVVFFFPST